MQKIITALTVISLLCTVPMACKKQSLSNSENSEQGRAYPSRAHREQDFSDCSKKTVSLCNQKNGNIGELVIEAATENKSNFTFNTFSNWKVQQIQLYAGDEADLPRSGSRVLPEAFPYQKYYGSPELEPSVTLSVETPTFNYTVSARVILVRPKEDERGFDADTVWANGCSNQSTNPNQYYFKFDASQCQIVLATYEPVNSCSKSISTVLGIDETYQIEVPWTFDVIQIAGHNYNESEARAIASTPTTELNADVKLAFMVLGTLRQTKTDLALSAYLPSSVATIESWLSDKGKISPTNLPVATAQVRFSSLVANGWIKGHICTTR